MKTCVSPGISIIAHFKSHGYSHIQSVLIRINCKDILRFGELVFETEIFLWKSVVRPIKIHPTEVRKRRFSQSKDRNSCLPRRGTNIESVDPLTVQREQNSRKSAAARNISVAFSFKGAKEF